MARACAALVGVVVASVMCASVVAASSPQQPTAPVPAPAPAQQPPVPGQPPGTPPVGPAPVQTRTFTAPAGLILTPVRPERVIDFEKVMAYFQAALEKSTDPTVREQAAGWRIFKATEAVGPANSVVYVYVIDPAVVGPDYGIGKILADAFPDEAAQLWKLYLGAVSSGGTLLNLTPVTPVEPPPLDVTTKPKSTPTPTPSPVPPPKP